MTRSEALIVLKRINYHAEYEEYDAITEAIRCVSMHSELVGMLGEVERFLFNAKFYPDSCNCYEEYICQSCKATALWALVEGLIKKAKGEE